MVTTDRIKEVIRPGDYLRWRYHSCICSREGKMRNKEEMVVVEQLECGRIIIKNLEQEKLSLEEMIHDAVEVEIVSRN